MHFERGDCTYCMNVKHTIEHAYATCPVVLALWQRLWSVAQLLCPSLAGQCADISVDVLLDAFPKARASLRSPMLTRFLTWFALSLQHMAEGYAVCSDRPTVGGDRASNDPLVRVVDSVVRELLRCAIASTTGPHASEKSREAWSLDNALLKLEHGHFVLAAVDTSFSTSEFITAVRDCDLGVDSSAAEASAPAKVTPSPRRVLPPPRKRKDAGSAAERMEGQTQQWSVKPRACHCCGLLRLQETHVKLCRLCFESQTGITSTGPRVAARVQPPCSCGAVADTPDVTIAGGQSKRKRVERTEEDFDLFDTLTRQ